MRAYQKFVLGVIGVAHFQAMLNDIKICVCGGVLCNAFQTVEKVAGVNANEASNTNPSDVSGIACDAICYVAVLLDLLPTRAVIHLRCDFHAYQVPLGASHIEQTRTRER